ncbi:MAG TPA: hypothetical protein VF393_03725 [archaeon]
MNGLELFAAIVIIEGCIAVGILFEGYFFDKTFKALQKGFVTRAQKGVATTATI